MRALHRFPEPASQTQTLGNCTGKQLVPFHKKQAARTHPQGTLEKTRACLSDINLNPGARAAVTQLIIRIYQDFS